MVAPRRFGFAFLSWSKIVFHWHLAILVYKAIDGPSEQSRPTAGVGREEWPGTIVGTKEEQVRNQSVTSLSTSQNRRVFKGLM